MLDKQTTRVRLDHIAFVNDIRNAVESAVIVNALHDTAIETWNQSFDANTQVHLIKGVFTSQAKTECINAYIAKLVGQYMTSRGARSVTWTKAALQAENFTTMAVINRINATEFDQNMPLFKIVATRLLGMDEFLIDFALAGTVQERAENLIKYMAMRYELSESSADVLMDYCDALDTLVELLEQDSFRNQEFLLQLIQNIQDFPEDQLTINALDMLPQFDKYRVLRGSHKPTKGQDFASWIVKPSASKDFVESLGSLIEIIPADKLSVLDFSVRNLYDKALLASGHHLLRVRVKDERLLRSFYLKNDVWYELKFMGQVNYFLIDLLEHGESDLVAYIQGVYAEHQSRSVSSEIKQDK